MQDPKGIILVSHVGLNERAPGAVKVANLKPAKLRGVESQGMLLAAQTDDGPVLAIFDKDVPPGAVVR